MKFRNTFLSALLLTTIALPTFAESKAGLHFGRHRDSIAGTNEVKSVFLLAHYGTTSSFDGNIRETKRAGAEFDDRREEYEKYLEEYSFDELGIGADSLFGMTIEKRWKFITLGVNFSYFQQNSSGVNSKEKFALEVEEIEFEGQEYSHMFLPRGTEFETEVKGLIFEPEIAITPIHLSLTENLHLTPFGFAGVYALGGRFTLDAGPAQGLTSYEFHSYPYVVGGEGKGWFGLGMPQIGFGAEAELEITEQSSVNASFKSALISWEGETSDLGVSSRHDKDLSVDFSNFSLNVFWKWGFSESTDLVLGIRHQNVEADATIAAKLRTQEERDLLREKYDKEADFSIKTTLLYAGLHF